MKKKNLLIIAIALVIAAVLLQTRNDSDQPAQDPRLSQPLYSGQQLETIDEVVIEKPGAMIHLLKKDGEWIIPKQDNYPVNSKALLELMDKLTSYRPAALITREADRLGHFRLLPPTETKTGDTEGTKLSLKSAGNVVFSLLLGKHRTAAASGSGSPPRDDGTYIRLGDEAAVYLIKENLDLDVEADPWMMKSLVRIEQDQIKAIRYETPLTRFVLERQQKEQELEIAHDKEKEKINAYERSGILAELKDFTIDGVVPRKPELESRLELKSDISVELFDGAVFAFQLLGQTKTNPLAKDAKPETTYYINLLPSTDPVSRNKWASVYYLRDMWLFTIDDWKARKWLKTRQDFVEPKENT